MALRAEVNGRLVQMMARVAGQFVLMRIVGIVPEGLGPFGNLAQVAVAPDTPVGRCRTVNRYLLVTRDALHASARVLLPQKLCPPGG